MNIEYLAPLNRSWDRCKDILFRPFRIQTWLALGFTAWVAGLMHGTGTGGGGFNVQLKPGQVPGHVLRSIGEAYARLVAEIARHPGTVALVGAGAVLALALALVFLWLSSRFKFIFLDNVVTGRVKISEPWRRLGALGDSLFLWRIGFAVAAIVAALLLVLLTAGLGVLGAAGMPGFIHRGLLFVVGLAALVIAAVLLLVFVAVVVENFIIPIMYRFNLGVLDAWRAFLPWFRSYAGAFIVYALFVVALAVMVGLGILVVGLMTCCIGWIIVALPYVGTVVLLPMWVTYRLLGPEFLHQLSPELALLPPAPEPPDGETSPDAVDGD